MRWKLTIRGKKYKEDVGLQNPALISKEGLASAAVLLAALSALPDVPPAHLAFMLAAAMWPDLQLQTSSPTVSYQQTGSTGSIGSSETSTSVGLVEAHLQRQGMFLAGRLAGMEELSRVCAVKGLVSVLPLTALCTPLTLQQQSSTSAAEHPAVRQSTAEQPAVVQGPASATWAPEQQLSQGLHAYGAAAAKRQVDSARSFPALDKRFAQTASRSSHGGNATLQHNRMQPGVCRI